MHRVSVIATLAFLSIPAVVAAQDAAKPAETAPAAKATPASDDKAEVTVYRYKQFVGKGLRPSIYCDNKDIARLQSGRYVTLALPAGTHSLRSNDKQSQIELELKPGQKYYIRIDIATGFWKGHGRLTMVMPEQGAGEVKQMKPVDAGMIKEKEHLAPGFVPTP
jgi:hypothetical protein